MGGGAEKKTHVLSDKIEVKALQLNLPRSKSHPHRPQTRPTQAVERRNPRRESSR